MVGQIFDPSHWNSPREACADRPMMLAQAAGEPWESVRRDERLGRTTRAAGRG